MNKSNHPFHLVSLSPWPLLTSMSLLNMFFSILIWMNFYKLIFIIISLIPLIFCCYLWWQNIIRESTFQGSHTSYVIKGLKISMMLFIISEIMFFMSFFWSFFHMFLSPSIEIGNEWPPKGINSFNPFNIPLLNTIILISSGFTITWSHHSILSNNLKKSLNSLFITIFLGTYFSILQMYEYYEAPFTISDGVYGSTFFISTGFHGIHVMVGTMFLLISLCRMFNNHFSKYHHFNFEAATWYWHFVDIVWLFLYIFIYWWSY